MDRLQGPHDRDGRSCCPGRIVVLIGADPCTDWLPSSVQRDAWGYIATGGHSTAASASAAHGRHSCSKRRCRASSRSATSGRVRSSAWRRLRAKEPSASDSSTTTSTNKPGEHDADRPRARSASRCRRGWHCSSPGKTCSLCSRLRDARHDARCGTPLRQSDDCAHIWIHSALRSRIVSGQCRSMSRSRRLAARPAR